MDTLDLGGIDKHTSALIVVDVQPDFLPGGSLAVEKGDAILAPVGRLMTSGAFRLLVATQDWHPPGHVSFASSHPGKKPFDVIRLNGHDQTLWPDHCVQGSPGAELHAGLPWRTISAVIRKGTDFACDSYSGFRNNFDAAGERRPTGLTGYLRERGILDVYVCGLARDVCCLWTAEDAAATGFGTHFLWDLTRPVRAGDDGAVREALERRGVVVHAGEPA